MPRRTSILPKAAVATLILDAGAARVSKGAVDALVDELQAQARVIADKSWKIAQHAGRRTVTADDVKLAR